MPINKAHTQYKMTVSTAIVSVGTIITYLVSIRIFMKDKQVKNCGQATHI